jgi:hypothetical protein
MIRLMLPTGSDSPAVLTPSRLLWTLTRLHAHQQTGRFPTGKGRNNGSYSTLSSPLHGFPDHWLFWMMGRHSPEFSSGITALLPKLGRSGPFKYKRVPSLPKNCDCYGR